MSHDGTYSSKLCFLKKLLLWGPWLYLPLEQGSENHISSGMASHFFSRIRLVSEWATDWVSEWVTDWLTEWASEWVSERVSESEWEWQWVKESESESEWEWLRVGESGWELVRVGESSESEWEWVKVWVSEWVSEWVSDWAVSAHLLPIRVSLVLIAIFPTMYHWWCLDYLRVLLHLQLRLSLDHLFHKSRYRRSENRDVEIQESKKKVEVRMERFG